MAMRTMVSLMVVMLLMAFLLLMMIKRQNDDGLRHDCGIDDESRWSMMMIVMRHDPMGANSHNDPGDAVMTTILMLMVAALLNNVAHGSPCSKRDHHFTVFTHSASALL
eukprot:12423701-Karenia_brevis.AAC.1